MMRVNSPGPEGADGGGGAALAEDGTRNATVALEGAPAAAGWEGKPPEPGDEAAAGAGAAARESIVLNAWVSDPALPPLNADAAGGICGEGADGAAGLSSVRRSCVRPPPPAAGGEGGGWEG